MSSWLWDNDTRLVEGGRLATESPGRHSVAGRIGRGSKPPPQFGQTLNSTLSTQSAQKVHSKVQMRAIVDAGGRSRSQHSQFGRSSRAMVHLSAHRRRPRRRRQYRLERGNQAALLAPRRWDGAINLFGRFDDVHAGER